MSRPSLVRAFRQLALRAEGRRNGVNGAAWVAGQQGDAGVWYCPNPECGNCAFEPGVCSRCGAEMEQETEEE